MKLSPEIYFKHVPKSLDMNIRSELFYTNEFTFTVAVILSAQCTDKMVNRVTPDLFAVADTPEKMIALGISGLTKHINVLSFFNNKAKSIIGLAATLVKENGISSASARGVPAGRGVVAKFETSDRHPVSFAATPLARGEPDRAKTDDYKFPIKYHNRSDLMKLPGIGQKTANVVMNVLWGAPNIGVDTHLFRNAHRYGWADDADNTPEKVEKKLLEIIPKKYHDIANHVMVLHGRYICKALKPKCGECAVAKWCDAKIKQDKR